MKRPLMLSLLGVLAVVSGCALVIPKETRYLERVQGRATQSEVRQELGAPAVVSLNKDGDSIWVYRIREEEPGSRWTSSGLWCDEYVLTFDRETVLRQWTHRSEFHGGERMPAYCVTGGYQSES